jgi:hypothetical protein
VLQPDGKYFACTSGRDKDPEIMSERYQLIPAEGAEAVKNAVRLTNEGARTSPKVITHNTGDVGHPCALDVPRLGAPDMAAI